MFISNHFIVWCQREAAPNECCVRFLSLCTWTFCGPRYGILACGELPDSFIEARQAADIIMKQTKIDQLEFRYGQDKVCCAATLSSAVVLFLLLTCRPTPCSAARCSSKPAKLNPSTNAGLALLSMLTNCGSTMCGSSLTAMVAGLRSAHVGDAERGAASSLLRIPKGTVVAVSEHDFTTWCPLVDDDCQRGQTFSPHSSDFKVFPTFTTGGYLSPLVSS